MGSTIREQIAQAKKSVAKLCKACPWLFQEYHNVRQTANDLLKAKEAHKKAKSAWCAMKKGD